MDNKVFAKLYTDQIAKGAPMLSIMRFILISYLFLSFLLGSLSVAADEKEWTQIELLVAAAFSTPDGGEIQVPEANYFVELTKAGHLKLLPVGGSKAILLVCQEIKHDESLNQAIALGVEGEENDVHILFLGVDGEGYEAIGLAGEIRSRGAIRRPISAKKVRNGARTKIKRISRRPQRRPRTAPESSPAEPASENPSIDGNPTPASGTIASGSVIDNSVRLEIAGIVFEGLAVIVHGPGYLVERIEGYSGSRHNDQPGQVSEMPIIFDYQGVSESSLALWYENCHNCPNILEEVRDISLIVNNMQGDESFRWNFLQMYPSEISSGNDGRTRYELRTIWQPRTPANPRNDSAYRLQGNNFGNDESCNPATDNYYVEIEGVMNGYPQFEIDEANRMITLTFDYDESLGLYEWVYHLFQGIADIRAMSVITEQTPGDHSTEAGRTNYFGVFPLRYQMTSGFGHDIKTKHQVVLSYDFSEEAH